MFKTLLLACAVASLFAWGCLNHPEKQAEEIRQVTPVATKAVPEVTRGDLDNIRSESQASNNAVQQSLTGLGLQLAKVAEKFEASLAKFETRVNANATAIAQVRSDLKLLMQNNVELRNEIKANTNLSAKLDAQIEATSKLSARLEALASAQGQIAAGVGNQLSQAVQKLQAGRDVVNTSLDDNMAKTLDKTIWAIVKVVGICVGAMTSFITLMFGAITWYIHNAKEGSRQRAEERSKTAEARVVHFESMLQKLIEGGGK